MTFTTHERRRAAAWKCWSETLPEAAREPAPYVDKEGDGTGPAYDFCLPKKHAGLSLLPEVRDVALTLFAELGIPWHAGVDGGPSNHLLSSQVQCVNALGQMVHDPERLQRAFGQLLGTAEVLEIEPGRHLTFEYTGDTDHLGEGKNGIRTRGAHCTSVDAAFLHRTTDGVVELVLVECKYTESYSRRPSSAAKDEERWRRYGTAWSDPAGPVTHVLPFAEVLHEPLYQLVRQQLLAHALETEGAHGAQRVRVVHVSPQGNTAYQQSLQPSHLELGDSVSVVWQQLLRRPDRFVAVDSELFLDEDITSREYVVRYSPDIAHGAAELLAVVGADEAEDVEDALYAQTGFDGDLTITEDDVQLSIGSTGFGLGYPLTWRFLCESARDLQEQVEAEDEWE